MCSCIERCSVEAGLKRAEEGDDRNWAGEESRPRREGLCEPSEGIGFILHTVQSPGRGSGRGVT